MYIYIKKGFHMIEEKYKIVLYDGFCKGCSATVNFSINHDKNNLYKYAPLQSPIGKEYLKKFNWENYDGGCVLIIDDKIYKGSTVALMVARDMEGIVRHLYYFIYIPRFFRDFIYNFISKHRYLLTGKSNSCHMPTEKTKKKFLF